ISPTDSTIAPGASIQLTAILKDSLGNTLSSRPINWYSSNPEIAVTSDAGMVTGVAEGMATITARNELASGTARIIVGIAVTSVLVSPSSTTLDLLEDSVRLRATPIDIAGQALPNRRVNWVSEDPSVATVDSFGLVRPVIVGSTTITAIS